MELFMNTQKECQQLEVYGEYLKKIPELLKQLETVEKMYQKAVSSPSLCSRIEWPVFLLIIPQLLIGM